MNGRNPLQDTRPQNSAPDRLGESRKVRSSAERLCLPVHHEGIPSGRGGAGPRAGMSAGVFCAALAGSYTEPTPIARGVGQTSFQRFTRLVGVRHKTRPVGEGRWPPRDRGLARLSSTGDCAPSTAHEPSLNLTNSVPGL